MAEIPEGKSTDEDEVRPASAGRTDSANNEPRPTSSPRNSKAFDEVDLDDDVDEEEEPVIQEIHQAAAPQAITRARIITVAKPIPPKLPPRNPFRARLSVNSDAANETTTRDSGSGASPPSTPSLNHDGSSASSQHSVASIEGLEHVSNLLQPHPSQGPEQKEEKDDFHSLPGSPIKSVPGGFN